MRYCILIILFSSMAQAKELNIIQSGFNSCKKIYKKAELEDGSTSISIDHLSQGSKIDRARKVYFKNDSPYLLTCLAWDGNQGQELLDFELKVYDPQKKIEQTLSFNDYLKLIRSYNPKSINIIGHSYGGWIAMKVVQNMGQEFKFNKLVTLDPISKEHCTVTDYVKQKAPSINLGSIFGKEEEEEEEEELNDCQRFPRDITEIDVEEILSQTNSWKNYYQLRTDALRSGPINSHPEINELKEKATHRNIFNDKEIWESFARKI